MLRTLGSLTLLLCIACRVASAADDGKATREDRGEQPRSGSKRAIRMIRIEVLIADVRHSDTGKGDAGKGDAAKNERAKSDGGDPKTLIQRLEKAGKLDSLTRVELTTVEGQKASLHVGQRVARIVGGQRMGGGGFGGGRGGGGGDQVNTISFENVGLVLGVTPQVQPDGLVVASINIERSQLGPAEEGPVISKPAEGDAIRAAPTETLATQTTISARSGQSVIVGLQQTRQPARQSELLIIVTPELLGNEPPPAER